MEYQYIVEENKVWVPDGQGREIARITFPEAAPGLVNIDHTIVDPAYGGQGIAGQLVREAVETIRKTGRRTLVTCSYAQGWFGKHPEYMFLLVDPEQAEEMKKTGEMK